MAQMLVFLRVRLLISLLPIFCMKTYSCINFLTSHLSPPTPPPNGLPPSHLRDDEAVIRLDLAGLDIAEFLLFCLDPGRLILLFLGAFGVLPRCVPESLRHLEIG